MGNAGATTQDSNNYVEPPRVSNGTNRMMTDFSQDPEVKETRRQAFNNGAGR